MGKGTDKLYITHSEWSSEDAFSASHGAGVNAGKAVGANFRRLPFNYCAISLQPFEHPVCTTAGTIFDLTNILPWLKKHGTNPIDGTPLKSADLIKLNFAKNDDGEYVDPVTYKVFTSNTHLVALRNTGNVFTWDTLERLNIKAKNWHDLVTDEEFSRKDIITLQDPQNIESRDLSSFKHVKEGANTLTEEQAAERSSGVNADALGSTAKILKAKEAVAKARADREKAIKAKANGGTAGALTQARKDASSTNMHTSKPVPYNAAQYTTGKAAASFTSTGLTPNTSGERALLTDEEYMLKPRRVKAPGYARIQTSLGDVNIELLPEFAPKAVWNFVQLAKKGYYRSTTFHRNIRNFMIQGGDPTGTGRGGQSTWGTNFADEFDGPNKHDARGIVSMANKGKNTNSSQFFITYRQAPHLDRKHTIFARVVGGLDVLARLEAAPVEDSTSNRPSPPIALEDVVVFVDPFEEFLKQKAESDQKQARDEAVRKAGGTDDDRTTWTGKRVRADGKVERSDGASGAAGVGRYLKQALEEKGDEDEIVGEWDEPVPEEPLRKKVKSGGFGNFEGW
ncbi:cyclophilin type peptidyl-prolyl cis-trans isomerase/CLD [Saccharata proteae CBS 121410]|uniref:Peptidyl-prolyl cis-trans isomerase-like 2 n=1 Tax=Saccharata proteae CBS 121410 TaxID=1314787 RepID=A0A9P4LVC1_9PEZI|nr:cyclophilin type peptidyl-prolyl cis-trans isomerase/CLD [Saccharata proteae CBS 121410]